MSQLSRLQLIPNSLARTVVERSYKFDHITLIIRSVHWLRITERINYKLLSLTNKVLTTTQTPYLHNLISVQRHPSTRSSAVVTLARLPTSFSLKIIDRSFRYASPCLSNLPFIFPSTSFWYEFLHFRLIYSFTHHFFLF